MGTCRQEPGEPFFDDIFRILRDFKALCRRNRAKLEKMASKCRTRPKANSSEILRVELEQVLVAATPEEIGEMVEAATVIIALAGPYLDCGEQVVKACAAWTFVVLKLLNSGQTWHSLCGHYWGGELQPFPDPEIP